MGEWFTYHLNRLGYRLKLYDLNINALEALAGRLKVKPASTLQGAVEDADLVVLCLPVEAVLETISQVARFMKAGGVLAEVSSVKGDIPQALIEAHQKWGISPLSLHPLFGPGATTLKGRRVALIPLIDRAKELRFTERLFPEATIVAVDAAVHDRLVAFTLSLIHFINTALLKALTHEDWKALEELSGTSFTVQRILGEALLADRPHVTAALMAMNTHFPKALSQFLKECEVLQRMVETKDIEGLERLLEELREVVGGRVYESYQKLYRMVTALEEE
jgi:prephenate dehydrogenase